MLIDNVRLISMVPGAPDAEKDRAVLVVGDRIVEVGVAGELLAPEGVLTIDASGHTLIPGLIDAHIHLVDEAELAGYLAHGVTGLRNMSGYPFHLSLPERIEEGRILGPDFVTTGPILNSRGPNENLLQQTVTTDAEARAVVRAQYDAGYRRLKLYSNLTRDTFDAIVDEAGKLGMRIMGHTPEANAAPESPARNPSTSRGRPRWVGVSPHLSMSKRWSGIAFVASWMRTECGKWLPGWPLPAKP